MNAETKIEVEISFLEKRAALKALLILLTDFLRGAKSIEYGINNRCPEMAPIVEKGSELLEDMHSDFYKVFNLKENNNEKNKKEELSMSEAVPGRGGVVAYELENIMNFAHTLLNDFQFNVDLTLCEAEEPQIFKALTLLGSLIESAKLVQREFENQLAFLEELSLH